MAPSCAGQSFHSGFAAMFLAPVWNYSRAGYWKLTLYKLWYAVLRGTRRLVGTKLKVVSVET